MPNKLQVLRTKPSITTAKTVTRPNRLNLPLIKVVLPQFQRESHNNGNTHKISGGCNIALYILQNRINISPCILVLLINSSLTT